MNEGKPKPITYIMSPDGTIKDTSPKLIFTDGKNELWKKDLTGGGIKITGEVAENPVATWRSDNSATIDSRAYEILKEKCGDDEKKLYSYLKTILDFEINHSDSHERHEKRLPIEQEILDLLKEGGYFT